MSVRATAYAALLAWTLSAISVANAAAEGDTAIPIKYSLAKAGRVSLAVYDANGRMVRPILYGQPHAAGDYTLSWDGLDRYGDSLAPGRYEWRLLETPGFGRDFLVNIGINTPWSPCDVWPGNHFGPNVLLMDDNDVLYVGSVSSEGPPTLLKISLDASKKYWDTIVWRREGGLLGLARIGNVLYLQDGTLLDIRRADNGQKFWTVPKLRRFAEYNLPFTDLAQPGRRERKKTGSLNFAGGRNFLVATFGELDEVRFIWPVDDRIDHEKTMKVPKPGAVTIAPTGQVFVVSGSDIVEVDKESGGTKTIVRNVPVPGKLAYDPVFNDLLVVSDGKCVRRFHHPDGKPVAVYGRPAGRTYGLFNPLDFEDLLDIAADRKGGFITVEQYPRRVAHFRGRERHELVDQWFGGIQWGALATIDPADPSIVYIPMDPKHLGRGKIDYKSRSWTLTDLYPQIDHESWNIGNFFHRDILPSVTCFWEVRHIGEQTFLLSRGGGTAAIGSVTVLKVDEKNNRILPVAHLGGLQPTLDRQTPPDWWLEAVKKRGVKHAKTFEGAGGYRHFAFSWSDANQNGLIDIDEISLASVGVRRGAYSSYVAPNWDIICPSPLQGAAYSVIRNEGTLELPRWNWDHATPGDLRYPQHERAVIHPLATSVHRDGSGCTYMTVTNGAGVRDERDVPPVNWPNNKNHSNRFLKWDSQGVESFSAGTHTDGKQGEPGEFADIRAILGEVKGCLVVMDACAPATVWTRDGLYAGSWLDDVNIPRNVSGWESRAYFPKPSDDNQWGHIVETPNGDVLWGQMRDNSTGYYRVTGWSNWIRQRGPLTLTEASRPAERNGEGLTAMYFAGPDLQGPPIFTKIDPVIWFGPMRGDHRQVPGGLSWFNQSDPRLPSQQAPVSVRWTGSVEPPVSEDFNFRLYTYGNGKSGARVRLWIADKLVIDSWKDIRLERFKTVWRYTQELVSAPIPLSAGHRVPIRIEYATPRVPEVQLHLYWSSRSFDLRHVPREYLYPDRTATASLQERSARP